MFLTLKIFIFLTVICWNRAQDYVDIDDEIIGYLLQGVKLRKCNCNAEEVFANNTCIAVGETTVPVLLFRDIFDPIVVNTSSFEVLANSGMSCGVNKYLTKIFPQDLFILSSGELLHFPTNTSFSPFEYCVDHIVNYENDITWEVQMCFKSPEVPICCPFKRDARRYCENPSLPVGYGFSLFKDAVIKTFPSNTTECSADEIRRETTITEPDIHSASVYISYYDEVTKLTVFSDSDHQEQPKLLNNDEFCIIPKVNKNKVTYAASFCAKNESLEHEESCKDFSCTRKCCPAFHLYSYDDRSCIPYNESFIWTPTFQRKNDSREVAPPLDLKITFGFPICQRSFYALKPKDPDDEHILLDSGELYVFKWNKLIASPRYCMDNFLTDLESHSIRQTTLICFPDEDAPKTYCARVQEILYPTLLMVSCVFLLITLIVYASIPELHAKLHGKSLLSHITSLFFAYLFLAIIQLMSKELSMGLCRGFAFVVQISFLGSFFWLNVMCFDIWWTLRSMRPVAETSDRFRRRFIHYSIYAWGCPLIIGAVTIAVELMPRNDRSSNLILPGFGHKNCWFQDELSLWVYFYSFVFILTVADIIFFICVAVILIQAQRANNGILRTTSKQHKERIWIYLKLFVVMGVTWICEVISWQEGSCEYWLITDIFNSLQGFFIFLIFICKKNIFIKLRNRGTLSTRKLRRMVQGSSSYGSSSQVTQQTSLESNRKISSSLQCQLSKLGKLSGIEAAKRY